MANNREANESRSAGMRTSRGKKAGQGGSGQGTGPPEGGMHNLWRVWHRSTMSGQPGGDSSR